jgi:hypothetical protein
MMIASALRRQSRPLSRIIRDFVLLKHPMMALAVGSAIFFSMIAITQESTNYDRQVFPTTEQIKELGEKSP